MIVKQQQQQQSTLQLTYLNIVCRVTRLQVIFTPLSCLHCLCLPRLRCVHDESTGKVTVLQVRLLWTVYVLWVCRGRYVKHIVMLDVTTVLIKHTIPLLFFNFWLLYVFYVAELQYTRKGTLNIVCLLQDMLYFIPYHLCNKVNCYVEIYPTKIV